VKDAAFIIKNRRVEQKLFCSDSSQVMRNCFSGKGSLGGKETGSGFLGYTSETKG